MNESMLPTSQPSNTDAPCCASCGPWWRLPLLLALVLAAMVLARSRAGRDSAPASEDGPQAAPGGPSGGAADAPPTGETVSLAIDFGDGRARRYDEMAWHDGMTADQLLAAARLLPNGITFARQGTGSSALLTEIDGVANQGGAGRNWAFFVNDRRADRSFGVYVMQPGDRVLWRFAPSR